MIAVGSGKNYSISVDTSNNRIHFKFVGQLTDAEGNKSIVEDTKKACAMLKPGFSALSDFSEAGALSLPDFAKQTQTALLEAGIGKMASVWKDESFAKVVIDSSAQKVGEGGYAERRRVFRDMASAEAWLNE